MEQTTQNLFDLQIDQQVSMYLRETSKWAKFLSILGFIGCGLLVLVAIFAGTFMAQTMSALGGEASTIGGAAMTITYILMALVYFFPCLYLFRFATQMQVALRNNDQQNLMLAFSNLKSCYKFLGILAIIGLAFYVIAIIFLVLGTALSGNL